MFCIFDLHENGRDFDYYVAAENESGIHGDSYVEITLPKGRYVQIEFMKRNHSAAAHIVLYIRMIWIELNGYETRKAPLFILYDNRFHRNYQKFGCAGENYLGDPVAVLHVPVK
jgi:predicted transcriptional regulator YdeE